VSDAATLYVALAIIVPELDGTIVAWQLAVVALTVVKVQGVPLNVPVAVPVFVNATVPAGVLAVPAAAASLTNAVQVTVCPVDTDVGVHETTVVVGRKVTLTVLLVPELFACAVSAADAV